MTLDLGGGGRCDENSDFEFVDAVQWTCSVDGRLFLACGSNLQRSIITRCYAEASPGISRPGLACWYCWSMLWATLLKSRSISCPSPFLRCEQCGRAMSKIRQAPPDEFPGSGRLELLEHSSQLHWPETRLHPSDIPGLMDMSLSHSMQYWLCKLQCALQLAQALLNLETCQHHQHQEQRRTRPPLAN